LIAEADIVIEGSRPRALQQLGLSAEELLADNPGLTWIGITGYGRAGDEANWIAFGDDAGVSAGLSGFLATPHGTPIFCGDAIGDPLTGLHAALAAYARWHSGAGGLVSIAIRDVIRHCIAFDQPISIDRTNEWQAFLDARRISAAAPSARVAGQPARPLGADTSSVLRELAGAC
jgi:crotonobetainyl-CoA:carnitine CoA-transferase CaiB-like acyl-CoA transferase